MFKKLKNKKVCIIVTVAVAVIAVAFLLINFFGLNSERLAQSLTGRTFSWTDKFDGISTGYSCDVTYTMVFLSETRVKMIGDGERIWKKNSNLHPYGKTEVVDYEYVTSYTIEGTVLNPVLKYTNQNGEEIEMKIEKSGGTVWKIGSYS